MAEASVLRAPSEQTTQIVNVIRVPAVFDFREDFTPLGLPDRWFLAGRTPGLRIGCSISAGCGWQAVRAARRVRIAIPSRPGL